MISTMPKITAFAHVPADDAFDGDHGDLVLAPMLFPPPLHPSAPRCDDDRRSFAIPLKRLPMFKEH